MIDPEAVRRAREALLEAAEDLHRHYHAQTVHLQKVNPFEACEAHPCARYKALADRLEDDGLPEPRCLATEPHQGHWLWPNGRPDQRRWCKGMGPTSPTKEDRP